MMLLAQRCLCQYTDYKQAPAGAASCLFSQHDDEVLVGSPSALAARALLSSALQKADDKTLNTTLGSCIFISH